MAVSKALRVVSGRSSKRIKDPDGIDAVVEVSGRGPLTLSMRRGVGAPLRAHSETDDLGKEDAGTT